MAQNAEETTEFEGETPSTYTTETAASTVVADTERAPLTVPGAAVGRRKQAIARVRLVPG